MKTTTLFLSVETVWHPELKRYRSFDVLVKQRQVVFKMLAEAGTCWCATRSCRHCRRSHSSKQLPVKPRCCSLTCPLPIGSFASGLNRRCNTCSRQCALHPSAESDRQPGFPGTAWTQTRSHSSFAHIARNRQISCRNTSRVLCNKLALKGVAALEINLYDLVLELLEARSLLERILKVEPTVTKDELLELLQGVLDPQEHIAPAIATKMAAGHFDVLFLTGAGEVYPYLRSHTILNNLQSIATDQPTVLSFQASTRSCLPLAHRSSCSAPARRSLLPRLFNIRHVRV